MAADTQKEIRKLEKKSKELKTLSSMNKISILETKIRLHALEEKIKKSISKLPVDEKNPKGPKKKHTHTRGSS